MTLAIVMTADDRFGYMRNALYSISRFVNYPATVFRIADDSGVSNPTWPEGWEVISHPRKMGLAAAVQTAWSNLPPEISYVLHTENDFLFTQPVDIDAMATCLSNNPQLTQLVLKRQPVNPEETKAGGFIELCPRAYKDRDGFVEHTRLFSLNSCLIPRWVVDRGWPDHGGEREFTDPLVAEGFSFGIWGARGDAPRIMHIGDQRSQGWML